MKKVTQVIDVYQFSELSETAKQKTINSWYENEDYYFLSDDLFELLKDTLQTKKIEYSELKHYFSLSYNQGDGYYFVGTFYWKNLRIEITHRSNHYYHSKTVCFDFYSQKDGTCKDDTKNAENFKQLYFDICQSQEKNGYSIIEYRMNNDEFSDLCEINYYNFDVNGKMINL